VDTRPEHPLTPSEKDKKIWPAFIVTRIHNFLGVKDDMTAQESSVKEKNGE